MDCRLTADKVRLVHEEHHMISYATIGTNDISKSGPFYTELLATQGVTKLFDHPRGGMMFGKDGKLVLGVLTPFDRNQATAGNGSMIALDLPSRQAVDEFHAKALSLGAVDEGAPGERGPGFYMGYFRDPEGNKFCACRLG
jgi:catechol 2,3-dioxygenase-like lactoylglutathione lyase family enzyme